MPKLFEGLIEAVMLFFGQTVGFAIKRAPILSAFFVIVTLTIVTYLTAMNALISSISVTVPLVVIEVWGWFLPSNVPFLLSALYAAKLAKWAHVEYLKAMKLKLKSLTGSN